MMAAIPNGTNQLAKDSPPSLSMCSSNNNATTSNMEKLNDVDAPPARRKPSSRRRHASGNALSNSLRSDRRGGIGATKGRLSVSFSDNKGLGAALIGDILSDFDDGDDEPEKSMEELLGVGGDDSDDDSNSRSSHGRRRGGGRRGGGNIDSLTDSDCKRMSLMTIQSQKAVTFGIDPKDLLNDSDED